MSRARSISIWPCAVWLTALACGGPTDIAVSDLDGATHTPLTSASGLQVFLVTSHECPIANAYAPVIAELAADWGSAVELWIVHADPDLDAAAAAEHARDYQLPQTVVRDPRHQLIGALGATKTPEAVVRHRGEIVYRGRIDDQWHGLGARAQQASVHDLAAAVAAVREGRSVATPHTDVIGCLLPEPHR